MGEAVAEPGLPAVAIAVEDDTPIETRDGAVPRAGTAR